MPFSARSSCCPQDFLTGRDIPMLNENAIANLLLDVDFLDEELKRNNHSHGAAFAELRSVRTILRSPVPSPSRFFAP